MKHSRLQVLYYKNLFLSLKTFKSKGNISVAKPILLMAIIKLIEDRKIMGNKIIYNDDLINCYNNIYKTIYKEVITSSVYPFYHLKGELFYTIKGDTSRKTPSGKFLREKIEYASLDDDLWEMLQNNLIREEFKEAIIAKYLK